MPRVAAGPLGVLIALPIAACFIKPGPPESNRDASTQDGLGPDDGTGMVDAAGDAFVSVDGNSTGICQIIDDFSGTGSACGAWGTASMFGAFVVQRSNGSLLMTASGSGAGQCDSRNPMSFANGFVIEMIANPTAGAKTSMYVTLTDSANTSLEMTGIEINADGVNPATYRFLYPLGSVGGNVGNRLFWNVRPSGTSLVLKAGTSQSNMTVLHTIPTAASLSTATVQLYSSMNSGSSKFDNLMICQ